jgi:hypothetical protein
MIQQTAYTHDRTKAAIRIAAALLKQRGELSISDIKAIPFLSSPQQVTTVVEYLVSNLHGEIYRKKVSTQPISRWEQFIRIKSLSENQISALH